MSFATKMFRFPFQAGEPLYFALDELEYKTTYDKFYICDFKEPLSRREVLYYALANSAFISTRQTTDMRRRATKIIFASDAISSLKDILPTCPEYLGMALGRFIPLAKIMGRPHALNSLQPFTQEWLQLMIRENEEQFFESVTDFWVEILPGSAHKTPLNEYAASGRSVWMTWNMVKQWEPIYKNLCEEGMPNMPRYDTELQMHEEILKIRTST